MTAEVRGVSPDMLAILHQATPKDRIKTRPGQGNSGPLSYVDARYVMDALDQLGPENWQTRFEDVTSGGIRCGIGINVDGEWVWKWDVGTESNIEEEKGAHSDAFKRAAVHWGIARDLYLLGHSNGSRPPALPVPAARASAPARGAPAAGGSPHLREGDVHAEGHRPLRTNARGLFCPTKLENGEWCPWREPGAKAGRAPMPEEPPPLTDDDLASMPF